jgi:hypothetical protein
MSLGPIKADIVGPQVVEAAGAIADALRS